ncbi:hypothetical protein SDC9_60744 [bioreactor metagenome]|uniref:Acyltransferase 3 domain-containing protein n=1 Tax=bioreactor metagenome TaxID=1076179 RepID=A0A644XDW4_9ZZZZ|nr:acyltransferase [Oscillospiraceae bacterium]
MNNSEKLKPEISAYNVLLCILVIFIHVSSSPVTTLAKRTWQSAVVFMPWRLSAFCVQGFIFLSGLKHFLNYGTKPDYRKFYFSRIKRIIIPYIIWNIIYFSYYVLRGYIAYSPRDLGIYILNGSLVSPFYFIVIIIQFYALAPVWHKMVQKINPIFMLVLSAILTFLLGQYLPETIKLINPRWSICYNDRVFTTYLFYWVAGCYAGINYEKFVNIVRQNRVFITIWFSIITLTESILSYLSFSEIKPIYWIENIHYLYCVSAVLFFFMFFAAIYEKRSLDNKFIKAVNNASYDIYLIHCLFIYFINSTMNFIGISDIAITYFIRIIVVYSCSIGISILIGHVRTMITSRKHLKI